MIEADKERHPDTVSQQEYKQRQKDKHSPPSFAGRDIGDIHFITSDILLTSKQIDRHRQTDKERQRQRKKERKRRTQREGQTEAVRYSKTDTSPLLY